MIDLDLGCLITSLPEGHSTQFLATKEKNSLVVEAVIDAVAAHNDIPDATPILRVGVWEEWLHPNIGPGEVGRRLVDALMKQE